MILRQFLHTDPITASYLLGCGGQSAGAVVDPAGDIAPHIAAAEATGMRILYVIDTHLHADHHSAGRALAEAAGARYVLQAGADTSYAFAGVQDGDVLDLGNVALAIMHTPGHTPEHISIVVTDRIRSADPWFILTGHTLMVGDLGRSLSGKPASTMGFERRNNRAFGIEDETEFLRMMAAGIPQPLPGASQIRAVNAGYPVSVQ